MTEQTSTTGVQDLIDRLSEEGVAEGQKRAEQIVSEAERKADDLVDAARQQVAGALAGGETATDFRAADFDQGCVNLVLADQFVSLRGRVSFEQR